MNKPVTQRGGSLLERAAQVYDFQAHLRSRELPGIDDEPALPDTVAPPAAVADPIVGATSVQAEPVRPVAPVRPPASRRVSIDRKLLAENGVLIPGAPIGVLAEEFRMAKRHLLLTARSLQPADPAKARTILVCSPRPNEGKTYCSVNLAISMAAESDTQVLLVDADFAKPDVMNRLGVEDGPGLLDALADPAIDIESCIVATDIPQLSLLPAGKPSHLDTELVASERTGQLIERLLAADPQRVLIFDSPPALAASPASVLALHVGQVMLVVRADRTSEGDIRDTVQRLDGCDHIQLLLNSVAFAVGGNRYGSYYGQEGGQ